VPRNKTDTSDCVAGLEAGSWDPRKYDLHASIIADEALRVQVSSFLRDMCEALLPF
jgi:hypothetical protein